MKLYDNGELVHVDSSKDIIEHFGIKGMKWGIRSRHKSLKDSYDLYKRSLRNCRIKVMTAIMTIWLITNSPINIMIDIIEVN